MIKLIILAIICELWFLGGWQKAKWSGYRDTLIPIILGFSLLLFLKGDWLHKIIASIGTIAGLNAIRIGYGAYDPEHDSRPSLLAQLTKDRQGAVIRMLYGLLVGLAGALCLVLMKYLPLPKYATYIGLNGLIGYAVSKLMFPVLLADICVAVGVGAILFLI